MLFPSIHSLPDDVCHMILSEWIPAESLIKLDIAYCSHKLRPLYLRWVKGVPMSLDVPRRGSERIAGKIPWCGSRQARVFNLYFMLERKEFQSGFKELLDAVRGEYPRLLSQVRSYNCCDGNVLDIAESLWPHLPALEQIKFHCYLMSDARDALQHVRNPDQVKKVQVTVLNEDSLRAPVLPPDCCFWELLPQLESLHLNLFCRTTTVGAWLSMYKSWTTLSCLRTLTLSAHSRVLLGDAPHPLSTSLPCLEVLELLNIDDFPTWSIVAFLIQHSPSINTLRLTQVGRLLPTTLQLLIHDVFPRLQCLKWQVHGTECLISVPAGQTLAPLMVNRGAVYRIGDVTSDDFIPQDPQELIFLRFVREVQQYTQYIPSEEPSKYKAFVGIGFGMAFEIDNVFWMDHLEGLHFLTDLELYSVNLRVDGKEMAHLLAFGSLRTLQFRQALSEFSSFQEGVQWCFAMGWTSKVQKLWIQEDDHCITGLSSLLPIVFPEVTHLTYQVHNNYDADLLCVLRMPRLQSLAFGGSLRDRIPLFTLDNIPAAMWEMIAPVSLCSDVMFVLLPSTSLPALETMLDSALGQRIKTVVICTNVPGEWRAALAECRDAGVVSKIRVREYNRNALIRPDHTIREQL